MSTFVIAYDVGTTSMKTCLFELADKIRLLADAVEGYELFMMENGGVEQDPEDWWRAMCTRHQEGVGCERHCPPNRLPVFPSAGKCRAGAGRCRGGTGPAEYELHG